MFGRIIFGLIGTPIGILMIIYTHEIVDRYTGPLDFAEQWFSSFGSGTYTFIRLFGFLLAVVSMMIMTGLAGSIYGGFISAFKGMSGI